MKLSKNARQRIKSLGIKDQKDIGKAATLLYAVNVLTFDRYQAIIKALEPRARV